MEDTKVAVVVDEKVFFNKLEQLKDEATQIYNENYDYRWRQARIYAHKKNNDLNIDDPEIELLQMLKEIRGLTGDICDGDKEKVRDKLSKIIILAYGLADITDAGDLDEQIFKQLELNENKQYIRDINGKPIEYDNKEE